ncbi:MAG TPA: hypothetical protein ENH91_07265 [Leeuwenhoekiella sp.]|nr:hypothetical protein [Leeuwenhoekiella sp.]
MKKIYYLSSCDTCNRIIKEIELPSSFIKQEIKTDPITEKQLEELYNLAGSYEALFSKRARLYKERDLKNANLDDDAMGALILEHYTFLKRPVIVDNGAIFIGNSKKTVAAAKEAIHSKDRTS